MAWTFCNRQSHDLEAMREELCKSKTELSQMKAELIHSGAQKEKLSSQVMLFTEQKFHLDTGVDGGQHRIAVIFWQSFVANFHGFHDT